MTKLMGILNVTPDSFSDGGCYVESKIAVERGLEMVDEGADIIDVGGESTRPGSEPVEEEEELRRTVPVVQALALSGVTISIDTSKPIVAREALRVGAKIVNDVTALRDPIMRHVCAEAGCIVCLMHMQADPKSMQQAPRYDDVVEEVKNFLQNAARRAEQAGISRDRIWVDPGIGFGKTVEHNVLLLRDLDQIVALGYPVLVGVSRKSFLGKIASPESPLPADQRLPATLAAQTLAQAKGAAILRAHDVREARQAMLTTSAILSQTL